MYSLIIHGFVQDKKGAKRKYHFQISTCLPVGKLLFILAYLEEGLWDGFVWRDHQSVFAVFQSLPLISKISLANILVPILALPQLTHYVLDGFIWKVSRDKSLQ